MVLDQHCHAWNIGNLIRYPCRAIEIRYVLWPSAVPEPSQSRTSSLTVKQGEMWIEQLSEETQWSDKKSVRFVYLAGIAVGGCRCNELLAICYRSF